MAKVITGITSRELFDTIEKLEIEDSVSLLKIFDRSLLEGIRIKKSFSFRREEEDGVTYGEFEVFGDNSEEVLWKLTIY